MPSRAVTSLFPLTHAYGSFGAHSGWSGILGYRTQNARICTLVGIRSRAVTTAHAE